MENSRPQDFSIEVFSRPGLHLCDRKLSELITDIRIIAGECFDTIPSYQAMTGTREELADKLISIARDRSMNPVGFCSMVFLPVEDVGEVLHLGLTCVRPMARGNRLTHRLVKRAVSGYLLKRNPFGKVWISNCATVLSSLGNVAMHFENVYPSPFVRSEPSSVHIKIARTIDARYRRKMYILEEAVLDLDKFVFRGSVRNTVFQKARCDVRYYHRKGCLNRFYTGLMNFDHGDEVIQVGYFRLASVLKYLLRHNRIRKLNRLEQPVIEAV